MRVGRKPWLQTGIRDLLGAVRRGGGDVTLTKVTHGRKQLRELGRRADK